MPVSKEENAVKAVLLAGGLGTRLSEETSKIPKPMVEIGGKPILWHIMKMYSKHGINDFLICLGYKGYVIKEYFANYFMHQSDITVDLESNSVKVHNNYAEPWRITLLDTGTNTMTGGRIKRAKEYLKDEDFCLTYGDGVSDVNISELIEFHKNHGKLCTVTAVSPPGRFGALGISENNTVREFEEKPLGDRGKINGGFFVVSPKVIDFIDDDSTIWERSPMDRLVEKQELAAFHHNGYWQPMDTLREKNILEDLWSSGEAPWKTW